MCSIFLNGFNVIIMIQYISEKAGTCFRSRASWSLTSPILSCSFLATLFDMGSTGCTGMPVATLRPRHFCTRMFVCVCVVVCSWYASQICLKFKVHCQFTICAMYLFSLWLGISLSTGVTGVRMVLIRSSDNLSRAMRCWPLFRTAEISTLATGSRMNSAT